MRFLIFILIICMIPFSYGIMVNQSGTSLMKDSVGVINLDSNNFSDLSSSNFKYWSCDMNVVPSVIEFDSGKCYCMDNYNGIGKDVIGVGNLIECINENSKGVLKTNVLTDQGLDYHIKLYYDVSDTTVNSQVSLNFSDDFVYGDSVVECVDNYSGNLNQKFILYREIPFQILDSSFNSFLTVPKGLYSGNTLKCRVLYYDEASWIDYQDSVNSLSYVVENLSISEVYMAPAYPEKSDVLYCYGRPYFDYPTGYLGNNGYSIIYDLDIMDSNGNVLNSSVVESDGDATLKTVSYNLSSSSKGDLFDCRFEMSLIDSEDAVVKSVVRDATSITVKNSRPVIDYLVSLMEIVFT